MKIQVVRPPDEVESEVSSLTLFRSRQEDLYKIVARDAQHVRRDAAVVLEVLPDGVQEHFNPHPGLNVLAVVGPGTHRYLKFPQAVLLEVGLGRGVPYHEARNGEWHQARYPLCHLAREDYAQLSPRIFQILQEIVNDRVARWKCGLDNPFILKMHRGYYTTRGKKLYLSETYQAILRGVRFSIARQDSFMLADAYWLQVHSRDLHLRFARFIDKMLSQYRSERLSFKKRKHVAWLIEEFKARCPRDSQRSWTPYMLVQLLNALPDRKIRFDRRLAEIIGQVVGWSGEELPEQQLVRSVCPKPAERLNGIQVRDISGLRPTDACKDHVVFEIFPSGRKEAETA